MIKRIKVTRSATWPTLALAACLCAAAMPAAAEDCEVKIGAVGPMTGGAASWGLSAKAGADFAAALANEGGGLQVGNRKCKVKVYSYDALYTAAGGAAASNYLASENVHATVGPVGSPETTGFRPVAKRNGQINFSSSYMAGVITPEFPLAFHALQAPVTWGPMLIKDSKAQFKFNTVMIVAPNDQGGTDSGKQLVKLYADQGVKATTEYYQRGTTNFAPLAMRIVNAKPDTIETSSVPPGDAAILAKQLLEAGYTGAIGSLGGVGAAPIIQGAGGVDKLKAFYWLETSPVDDPGVVKMKADYTRLMKAPPPENPLFPVYTVAAEQILRAISIAGTDQDPEKIATALRQMTPESRYLGKGGWRGKTNYGINQELAFPVGLGMAVDGKKLPVRRIDIPAE
ncbi:ABC transporter substrate-binding protein [Caballeronia zhejiangensis]|uniref:ABC transporter substrate-binding protein n=1 Tax=Caballeronia zhejiangensis TaxID=871203 RepID=UPI001EF55098|nr:ABC transporter substrate-binding protein [Caballeronia zhejiangensis]MCG7400354.1 ABC transporter substrate-binding protein [Caballeronia zhejiangensis]